MQVDSRQTNREIRSKEIGERKTSTSKTYTTSDFITLFFNYQKKKDLANKFSFIFTQPLNIVHYPLH